MVAAVLVATTMAATATLAGDDNLRASALKGSDDYKAAVTRYLDKVQPKIVGGVRAPDGAYPWIVSLGVSWIADPFYAHFCGGTVFSEKWIVTAAHCVTGNSPADIVITAGTNVLEPGSIRRNVNRIVVKSGYASAEKGKDIALLELLDPLPIGVRIAPLPLLEAADEGGMLVEDAPLTVAGWGATGEGGDPVIRLQHLEVPFVLRTVCNEPIAYDGRVLDDMICAGFTGGGGDSCQGDSGGPIDARKDGKPVLAGVVSWGEGCARTNKVGVYTRVTRFGDWVAACVQDPIGCQ
jgi:secreted trypsin-like serine protease